MIVPNRKEFLIYWVNSLGRSGIKHQKRGLNHRNSCKIDDMDTEIIEGNGDGSIKSGYAYSVQTIGINSVTIHDSNPYFFLFADIDTKDTQQLLEILKVYKYRNLSCYYYETTKGWHVVSPVLMSLRRWVSASNQLRSILPDYSFDTIRYTTRHTDGKILHFEDWNHKNLESYDLHYYITLKFYCGIKSINPNMVSSKLEWVTYNQLRLKKIRHY